MFKKCKWYVELIMLALVILSAVRDALRIELVLALHGAATTMLIYAIYLIVISRLAAVVSEGIES